MQTHFSSSILCRKNPYHEMYEPAECQVEAPGVAEMTNVEMAVIAGPFSRKRLSRAVMILTRGTQRSRSGSSEEVSVAECGYFVPAALDPRKAHAFRYLMRTNAASAPRFGIITQGILGAPRDLCVHLA